MNNLLTRNNFVRGLKNSLFILPAALMTLSSCSQSEFNFSGTLVGVDTDTLLVFVDHMIERKNLVTDTVALNKNHFELQIPDSAAFIRFVPKPGSPNAPIRMFQGMPIMFFPGDRLEVNGSIDNYEVSGSELYDGLASYTEIAALQERINEQNLAFREAYIAKDEAAKERIKKEVGKLAEQMQKAKFDVIRQDPTSVVSAYFATQLKPEKGLEAIELLEGKIANESMNVLVQKSKDSYEKRIAKEKARLAIQPGKQAPDFQFTTLDGKKISLSTFQGKYLLIDFWGTWCGWCVKGMPSMKDAYAKYRNHLEILGISCGDTEKKWRDGVAKYQLPWVNVLEGESNASTCYAVGGFPTKILVDPQGKIVEVFVGETPELYKRLKQIFGK